MDKTMNNKASERFFVEAVRECLPAFPAGELTDFENPDFLVRGGGRLIGIEVTRLMKEKGFERERFTSDVTEVAKRLYSERGGRPLQVAFQWHTNPSRSTRRDALASRIAEALARWVPSEDGGHREIGYDDLRIAHLDDVLAFVHVWRCDAIRRCNFVAPQSEFIGPPNEAIRAAVAKKEARLAMYRRSCHVVWLLLVAEGMSLARTFDMSRASDFYVSTGFDCVVLFDLFRARACMLQAPSQVEC